MTRTTRVASSTPADARRTTIESPCARRVAPCFHPAPSPSWMLGNHAGAAVFGIAGRGGFARRPEDSEGACERRTSHCRGFQPECRTGCSRRTRGSDLQPLFSGGRSRFARTTAGFSRRPGGRGRGLAGRGRCDAGWGGRRGMDPQAAQRVRLEAPTGPSEVWQPTQAVASSRDGQREVAASSSAHRRKILLRFNEPHWSKFACRFCGVFLKGKKDVPISL